MNKAQIQRAANIYALAVIAHQDHGGATERRHDSVIRRARIDARNSLKAMGINPAHVVTLNAAIDIAIYGLPRGRSVGRPRMPE